MKVRYISNSSRIEKFPTEWTMSSANEESREHQTRQSHDSHQHQAVADRKHTRESVHRSRRPTLLSSRNEHDSNAGSTTAYRNWDGGSVLVIDDHAGLIRMLEAALRSEGYKVLTSDKPAQGIEIFRQYALDISVVVLDAEMPRMSGTEVFDVLASIRSDVKVIVLSGLPATETRHLFRGRAVVDFLEKPFSLNTLVGRLRLAAAGWSSVQAVGSSTN